MPPIATRSPRMTCQEFGIRLRARRIALLMPQEELARRAGVSVGTIKNLESRPWSISLEHLVCVVESLQLGHQLAPLFKGWRAPLADLRPPGSAPRQRARPRPRRRGHGVRPS